MAPRHLLVRLGEAFEFEYLAPGDSVNDARLGAWARNLAKLGISFKVRNVDYALFSRRLEEYDFDVVTIAGQNFEEPVEVTYALGSQVIRPTVTSVSSSLITVVSPSPCRASAVEPTR